MDKRVINNYVVQMRPSVIQARVQTLSKLIREIKKLENKKGNDEQKEKNCQKAERLRQEVIFMKKLDPYELSKYALISPKDASEMLKVSLSIEERAKVRLAAHKSVAQQVEIFRAKYPEWASKLPPLLVQLGLRTKNKKNKSASKGSNIVTGILNVTRNNEALQVKNKTEKKTVREDNGVSAISRLKRSSEKIKEEKEEENKWILSSDKIIESKSNVSGDDDDDDKSSIDNVSASLDSEEKLQEAKNETNILSDKYKRKKKVNGIAEVCRFADLLESDGNSENPEIKSQTVEDNDLNPTNSATDSFFLRGDGSGDELNSSEEMEDQTKSSDSSRDQLLMEGRDKRQERTNIREKGGFWNFQKKTAYGQQYSKNDVVPNRKQRRILEKVRSEKKKDSTFSQAGSSFPKHFEASGKRKFLQNSRQKDFNTGSTAEKQEKLHPSWEAKRKEKIIVPFQGKKIKFDDD